MNTKYLFLVLFFSCQVYSKIYYLPNAITNEEKTTRIGIVNPNDFSVSFQIYGYNELGDLVQSATELDLLESNKSLFLPMTGIFDNNPDGIKWVLIYSYYPLHVFCEVKEPGSINAYWSIHELTDSLFLPHIAKNTAQFSTEYYLINGSSVGIMAQIEANPDGIISEFDSLEIAFSQEHKDILEVWPDVSNINWAKFQTSLASCGGIEQFSYKQKKAAAALGLSNESGKLLRFLHVATDTSNFWTGMVYINVNSEPADITELYYDSAGNLLKTFDPGPLTANGKTTLLFDEKNQERVPAGTSWVEVQSNKKLVGYELFGSANDKDDETFAGIQGNYSSGNQLDYPYPQDEPSFWTGIVAVNVGNSVSSIIFQLHDSNGNVISEIVRDGIQPKEKIVSTGEQLFPGVPGGKWIRATASNSEWAGFMLWGDEGGDKREYLAGLNAFSKTNIARAYSRTILPMTEGNTSYEHAMELIRGPDGFDVNVIGHISKSIEGSVVNQYPELYDDLEAVFTFNLIEPTELLIAIGGDNASADLDLIVVRDQVPSENFFGRLEHIDTEVSFAATPFGDESVAYTFLPGTYYIFVTIFENSDFDSTDFGLLVTEHPIYLNCFDNPDSYEQFVDYKDVIHGTDADGVPGWGLYGITNSKYGTCLSNLPGQGDVDYSGVSGPFLRAPENGRTIFDFDFSIIFEKPVNIVHPRFFLWGTLPGEIGGVHFYGFEYGKGDPGSPFEINGETKSFLMWKRWVRALYDTPNGAFFRHSLEPGFPTSLLFQGRNDNQRILIDNLRVFNVLTSEP